METRKFKYNNDWKTIGDYIKVKENLRFLFWTLPIKVKRTYKIFAIGEDSCAAIVRKNYKLPLNGPSEVERAFLKNKVRELSGPVEITIKTIKLY